MRVPSTNGVELALHDLGGDGPPLLVAHATGLCAGAYRPLAAALAPSFHVWAVDFRGHGDATSPADGDFGWDGMADDVLACVDALGIAPGELAGVGHSMGGAALMLAELARPGLLRAAWLYEPIILPSLDAEPGDPDRPGQGNHMAEAARRRRPGFASKAEALQRYAGRPPLGVLRADALAAYVDAGFHEVPDGTVTLACTPEHEAATFEGTGKATVDQLTDVAVPVTFARGTRDPEAGVARFAELAADRTPDSRLRRYHHLGHFGPLQDPDGLAADIVADLSTP